MDIKGEAYAEAREEIERAANALSLIPTHRGGHRHTGSGSPLLTLVPLPAGWTR